MVEHAISQLAKAKYVIERTRNMIWILLAISIFNFIGLVWCIINIKAGAHAVEVVLKIIEEKLK